MRLLHQIKAFELLLEAYDHSIPLHRFLPTYYKKHKNMGSSDRRWASRYLYSYFRLGNALIELPRAERLAVADFLCNDTPSLVVAEYFPEWAALQAARLQEKIDIVSKHFPTFSLDNVFSFRDRLSTDINAEEFLISHFIQPDLFIAATEKSMDEIEKILSPLAIAYERIGNTSMRLPNATKLAQLIPSDVVYRVQDLSSQQTAAYLMPKKYDYWWDCCAASGGKSLLLHHLESSIQLLVSDVRESILYNLKERFNEAGIKKYQTKVLDLTVNNEQYLHHYSFDGIVLDAPCTGSGTWGRTPEMLLSFNASKISAFSQLQKKIAANVIPYLKTGSPLVYITCSVFKSENEEVVQYLLEHFPLTLEKMEQIEGYNHKADTMFVARLIKK